MRTEITETDEELDSTSSLALLSVKSSPISSNSDYMFVSTLFNFHLRPRRGIDRYCDKITYLFLKHRLDSLNVRNLTK